MFLHKGSEAEYKRRHDEIWPELKKLLEESGITEYSIFLEEASGILFAFMITREPARVDALPQNPVMQKWWDYMKDIMETRPDNSPLAEPLSEVFHMP
jgi:L-rhamnose mutarotase